MGLFSAAPSSRGVGPAGYFHIALFADFTPRRVLHEGLTIYSSEEGCVNMDAQRMLETFLCCNIAGCTHYLLIPSCASFRPFGLVCCRPVGGYPVIAEATGVFSILFI